MRQRLWPWAFSVALFCVCASVPRADASEEETSALQARVERLQAQVEAAEDMRAIKRLQRAYGYYLDKGMWEDLAAFFTEDAVANYPAGVFIGRESIRKHLFMNVGGGKMGEIGLGHNRLYNHMSIQPVVHLDPGGETAKGRWRAFAMFGSFGGNATWAEGVYEMTYAKENGVWKIKTLDYYSGFAAPYETGWVAPKSPRPAGGARRKLAHPPDRERKMECEGFPAACIAPFHYENPGTSLTAARAWTISERSPAKVSKADLRKRVNELAHRAMLLQDEQHIENLQRIYGYYLDRAMWDQVADLFAEDATLEMGLRGVYVGKKRIRDFLNLLGPHGLKQGWLNDHIQLQVLVTVSPDGKTAWARSRELAMKGTHGGSATWSEGIYENSFVKENGVWKIKSLRFYPTFITDYDRGWAKDAQQPPTVSTELPPDRPPTEVYEIYPKAHVPPFHYRNPVTGEPPRYPAVGGPSRKAAAAALARMGKPKIGRDVKDLEALLTEAERRIERVRDFHEIENLESAYGYYLDKNLWNSLADLFAADGSMELAQRGVYKGQPRVREFLLKVFGRGQEGPVEGRLGNHIQMQPVISIDENGESARIRVRMFQQMSMGGRASLGGAIYENEAVKENGVWKLRKLHAYNTFTAGYEGGWARSANPRVPGPSQDLPPDAPPTLAFEMFPVVYDFPYHYANPVSGRTELAKVSMTSLIAQSAAQGAGGAPSKIPADVAAALREIGPRIDGPKTAALYAPLHPKEPYPNVSLSRDLSYGPHERHKLDVFTSPDKGSGKPVVVFIHGGGFSRGAKNTPGSPFYDNVGLWAASKGLVGVTINYRLAPEFQFPSGVEDLTRVVAWLKANIAQHGGDPNKIFLWGHSAGAAHAADYIANAANTGKDAGIAGAILTSGIYDLGDTVSIWKDYYGEDVSKYKERSSVPGLLKTNVPLFVTYAELDPPNFVTDTEGLIQARQQAGRPLRTLLVPGHSHISELYAVGTTDDLLSGPVLEFIRETAGGKP